MEKYLDVKVFFSLSSYAGENKSCDVIIYVLEVIVCDMIQHLIEHYISLHLYFIYRTIPIYQMSSKLPKIYIRDP